MKVIIKRVKKLDGDHFFRIYDDKDTCLMSFYFNPEITDPDSVLNEKYALEQAQKHTKVLESGTMDKDIEEIVYETPDDIPNEIFQNHQS